jgi:mono/diheme cytochrome c family protein
MESLVGPTIALIAAAVLFLGGIVSIASGLFGPKGGSAAPQGAPAMSMAGASSTPAHPPEPAGPERYIFGGLAIFIAVVVAGLTLAIPIPGRGTVSAALPLTKVEPKPTADLSSLYGAELGKQLYVKAACNTCHSANKGERIVGPSAYGQFVVAATRKPGLSAREYLRESIETPNAFVVEGFPPGVMPQTFKQTLKPEEIDAILDYIQRDFNQQ